MRYWVFSILLLLLASPVLGQREHFGFDAVGGAGLGVGSAWTYANCWSADHYTASTGDVVDSLWVYVRSPSASDDSMKMAIYTVDKGLPDEYVMESERFGVVNEWGWYGIAVNQALTNGVTYTLACGEFFGANTWYLGYEVQTDAGSEGPANFPLSWTAGTNNWRFSMYAVYTPGNGEPAISPRRRRILLEDN